MRKQYELALEEGVIFPFFALKRDFGVEGGISGTEV
jgi:hypothetical protein